MFGRGTRRTRKKRPRKITLALYSFSYTFQNKRRPHLPLGSDGRLKHYPCETGSWQHLPALPAYHGCTHARTLAAACSLLPRALLQTACLPRAFCTRLMAASSLIHLIFANDSVSCVLMCKTSGTPFASLLSSLGLGLPHPPKTRQGRAGRQQQEQENGTREQTLTCLASLSCHLTFLHLPSLILPPSIPPHLHHMGGGEDKMGDGLGQGQEEANLLPHYSQMHGAWQRPQAGQACLLHATHMPVPGRLT